MICLRTLLSSGLVPRGISIAHIFFANIVTTDDIQAAKKQFFRLCQSLIVFTGIEAIVEISNQLERDYSAQML